MPTPYLPIIGLEIHVQLRTQSKMFCACAADYFGAEPNTHTCPVCLGLPGALPVANEHAIMQTLRVGLALGSTLPPHAKFDRKNYFYPDLPKGYQISQYDQPLCVGGKLDITLADGSAKTIGITRAHLEEDTGKSLHQTDSATGESYTLLDYNKCGVPLLEIVSEPDMRTIEEASLYARKIRQIVRYIGASDADMEKGQLRFDVNISVGVMPEQGEIPRSASGLTRDDGGVDVALRPQSSDGAQQAQGDNPLPDRHTPIVEIKNLNSFNMLEKALVYEIDRQIAEYEQTGELSAAGNKTTRGWDDAAGETVHQRGKEEANDYRYFPEPDLPPMEINRSLVDKLREELPELPAAKILRYEQEYGLRADVASVLIMEPEDAKWFETAIAASSTGTDVGQVAGLMAKWLNGDVTFLLREQRKTVGASALTPEHLVELADLVIAGKINSKIAKDLLPEVIAGASPAELVQTRGLGVVSDTGELSEFLDEVIAENPEVVAQIRGGKETAIMFLVGQVMKKTRGQAEATTVQGMLKSKIQST